MQERDEDDAKLGLEDGDADGDFGEGEGEAVEFGHLRVALREDALGEGNDGVGSLRVVWNTVV